MIVDKNGNELQVDDMVRFMEQYTQDTVGIIIDVWTLYSRVRVKYLGSAGESIESSRSVEKVFDLDD